MRELGFRVEAVNGVRRKVYQGHPTVNDGRVVAATDAELALWDALEQKERERAALAAALEDSVAEATRLREALGQAARPAGKGKR